MSKPLRLGLIGCGMGRCHGKAILATDGAELTAIAEPGAERRDRFYTEVGEAPCYADYREMIEKAGLDAVVNALPTDMHADSSAFALEHGLHVLCEKPPATNAADMLRVARLARKHGRLFMFARQQRFNPSTLETHAMVGEGHLGNVYHAESKWMRARGIPFRGGWGVNKDVGGGVLLDLGVHKIDDAWFVMGCPKPVSAFAGMHCAFAHLAPNDLNMPYNADDATTGMVRFENGATLSFTVTFALHTAGPDDAPVTDSGKPDWQELKVYGDRGGIDVVKRRFIVGVNGHVNVTEVVPREQFGKHKNPMDAQHAEFVRAIRAGDASQNTAEQAVMLMQMLDAVKRSAETGESVRIEPFEV